MENRFELKIAVNVIQIKYLGVMDTTKIYHFNMENRFELKIAERIGN